MAGQCKHERKREMLRGKGSFRSSKFANALSATDTLRAPKLGPIRVFVAGIPDHTKGREREMGSCQLSQGDVSHCRRGCYAYKMSRCFKLCDESQAISVRAARSRKLPCEISRRQILANAKASFANFRYSSSCVVSSEATK